MNKAWTQMFLFAFLMARMAAAFNGEVATEGPLVLTIGEIEDVTQYNAPRAVTVLVKNTGKTPLSARLTLKDLVDEWRAIGPSEQALQVASGKEETAKFQIAAGPGAYSALYPVHVYAAFQQDGREMQAHAVRIFQSRFEEQRPAPAKPAAMTANAIPAHGALTLDSLKTQRVAWAYFDQPLVYKPIGWEGSDAQSSANFGRSRVTRGEEKPAIQMHPPYKGGKGSVFAEYLLQLPPAGPIHLQFSNAIRDNRPDEPKSDGVTFRVWVNEEKLFDRHTDSKTWVDGAVDLSRFAGQEILLRLESHPGPKQDTTCDSSYWGEPVVFAGSPPPQLAEAEKQRLAQRAREAAASGTSPDKNTFAFPLGDSNSAAIALGPNGLVDSAIAFASETRGVIFDGLNVSVLGNEVGRWPSAVVVRHVEAAQDSSGHLRIVHALALAGDEFNLTTEVWAEGPGLRVKTSCPKPISDIAPGPADRKAPRVYYGHGYCIVEPKAFRAAGGGHNLSTSHVGFDFDGGLSLLMACDAPPDSLEVDPARRLYTLHTHPDATFTFVPGRRGAFDCAIRYRPLYDKKPSGGVPRKAGRFVFDIWGARYADAAKAMQRAFAYGLTDSMLILHSWQRWGYDYRLPDVYPPDPRWGTLEELREVGRICGERDVPWGLHDNYIDFYPDATGFSYDRICFNEQGEPIKAWLNDSRGAQSYKWRPDQFMPFLQRNLELIKANLAPTAYFLDVFASSGSFDFRDRQGTFHSKLETRRCWGGAFAWIRDCLGGNAPTVSEAGGDHLIGFLDGADCQHLQLSASPLFHESKLDCQDWERTPWFDAVNHARFILHGAGYSIRYQGDRSRAEHGIESDDYITDEMLLGHALMIDRGALDRGAVRKYWLGQDFIRGLALDEIENVEFVDGGIHRQIVDWKSGARVWVNRGETDWAVEGRTLPQYGYLAQSGAVESSIEKIGGVTVEQSRAASRFYVNARGFDPDPALRIRPSAQRVDYLGGRRFKMMVDWDVEQPPARDLRVYMQFLKPQKTRLEKTEFHLGGAPATTTSQWKGRVTTGDEWTAEIPQDWPPGRYDILVGLSDPKTNKPVRMLGDETNSTRYRIGALVAEGEKGNITKVALDASGVKPPPASRMNDGKVAVDFGPAVTTGAFRCEMDSKKIVVTPLPDGDSFSVTLRLDRMTERPAAICSIQAIDAAGSPLRDVPFEARDNALTFQVEKAEFAYCAQ